MTTQKQTDITKMSVAEAFEELEAIAKELETEDVDLEKGIPKLKRGHELAQHVQKKLQVIENEIEEIQAEFSKESDEN